MNRALVIAWLVLASSVAHAQPVTIGWRPPAGCSTNDLIKWNGTSWVCGTPASPIGGLTTNTIPKATSSSTIGNSQWTDNGTTTAYRTHTSITNDSFTSTISSDLELALDPGHAGGNWLYLNYGTVAEGVKTNICPNGCETLLGGDLTAQGASFSAANGKITQTATTAGMFGIVTLGDISGNQSRIQVASSSQISLQANDIYLNNAAGTGMLSVLNSTPIVNVYVPLWVQGGIEVNLPSTSRVLYSANAVSGALDTHLRNTSTNAAASAKYEVANDASTGTGALVAYGTGFTTAGGLMQDSTVLYSGAGMSNGLNLIAAGAAAPMRFYTGGSASGDLGCTLDIDGVMDCVGLKVGGVDVATGSGISGLTTNQMVKASSATTIADAWPSDDGTTWGVASKFTITEASGNFRSFGTATVDGTSTLTGLVTATAGGTTPANWTTTGTGDLVSADDLTVADDATITDVLSAGSDGFEVTSSGTFVGDTSNTSIANNLTVLTIGNTGTGQTGSSDLISGSRTGTFDTTGGAVTITGERQTITAAHSAGGSASLTAMAGRFEASGNADDNYGIYTTASAPAGGACSQCETTGINHAYAIYATASAGGGLGWSGYFTGGAFHVDGSGMDVASGIQAQAGIVVSGSALDVQTSISNSAGTLALGDDVDFGSGTSSVLTFKNGPIGANLNYSGRHLEWADEFMNTSFSSGFQGPWSIANGSAGSSTPDTAVSGRPGLVLFQTNSNAAGSSRMTTGTFVDFDDGTWSTRAVIAFPTLSTSSEEYRGFVGFSNALNSTTHGHACVAIYDRGNTTTNGANAGNADKWELCTGKASTNTCVILDGTTQGGITTVDSPVVAGTYYNVLVTGSSSSCSVAIDGTTRATITTNIPTAAIATGFGIAKSAGTTSRTASVDYASLAVDLVSTR